MPKNSIKVVQLPWSERNPYQKLLAESLNKHGIETTAGIYTRFFLLQNLRRWKSKILHFHWVENFFLSDSLVVCAIQSILFVTQLSIAAGLDDKIVWTAHNLRPHENAHPWLENLTMRFFVRRCDAVFVHGETARDRILDRFEFLAANKIHVIAHGHYRGHYKNSMGKTEARRRLGLTARGTVFLFFGNIRTYKGVDLLIKAFRGLPDGSDAHLVIAGESRDAATDRLVRRNSKECPRIHYFPGAVPDDDVQLHMNACDAVVLPYREGLTSGVAVLAISFGRACIAVLSGCMRDALDEEGSIFYSATDSNGLLNALKSAESSASELEKMGFHNLTLLQRSEWSGISEKTISIYRDLSKPEPNA